MKFQLGHVVATPRFESNRGGRTRPAFFLDKHAAGDWGEVDDGDKALNDQALVTGADYFPPTAP